MRILTISLCSIFFFQAYGQEENLPKSAYQIFVETVTNNIYPLPDPYKGVLDGDRLPPERISMTSEQLEDAKKIKYLIIIFQENWSFDSLYGNFPNVNGISKAKKENMQQTDLMGRSYPFLLPCINSTTAHPYPKIPEKLPNGPFDLNPFLPMDKITGDAIHQFYQEQYQINGGMMNRFATWSNAGGFAMSYYDINSTPMGRLAKEYVICDNWFHSCYGGSMCGALWLFTAQMPLWPNASEEITARLLPSGILIKDGFASPDGFAINDAEPFYHPFAKGVPEDKRVPPQNYKTIGDLLSEKGISWGWYAEGWNNAVADKPDKTFAYHHQAPVYFKQFAPGTEMREKHLLDLDQFYESLRDNKVPAVSFIRSIDRFSEHPSDGTLIDGLNFSADLVKKIQESAIWEECAIIITYDENGGRWDHVSPPIVDRFGPGTRVPAIIVSPFAKKGYIDSTSYETVSILKFIEQRYGLPSLSERDKMANNVLNAFDFSQE